MPSDLTKRLRERQLPGLWSDTVMPDTLCVEAATEIERLEAELARQPKFEGVAKFKLDDLTSEERGWSVCGYAMEKNGEYGLITTGAFVGWWTVADNNARAAQAEVERLREALSDILGCTHRPNPTDPSRIDVAPGKHRAFQSAIERAKAALDHTGSGG